MKKTDKKNLSVLKSNSRLVKKLGIPLISILAFAIYFQTTNFEYTLDDRVYTYDNAATTKGLNGLKDIFGYGSLNFFTLQPSNSGTYRPLTLVSFAIEHELSDGFEPSISHTINLVLYLILTILLGSLLFKLFQKKKINLIIPLLILLLFIIHPLHIEAVASVKSRDILLAANFVMASLLLWIKSFDGNNNRLLWLSIIFYMGALFSKEDSITFVAVFFIISFYFYETNFIKSFIKTFPFIISAIVYLIIRFNVLDQTTSEGLSNILNNIIYATEGSERFASNLNVWINYLKLTFYPFHLSYDYSYNQIPIVNFTNIWPIISLIIFVLLIWIAIKSLQTRSILGFGIWFYLITFSIYSNLFPEFTIGSTLAERFLFIPILGLIISFIMLLQFIGSKVESNKNNILLISIIGIIAISFIIKDLTHIKVWKNDISLFKSGVESSPDSWRTHAYYANALKREAQNILNNEQSNGSQEKANNLIVEAIAEYKKSIEIFDDKARLSIYHIELGNSYLFLKDSINAIKSFQNALIDNPNSEQALYNIFMISYGQKNFNQAINYGLKLLELNPSYSDDVMQTMARSYVLLNDYEKAINILDKSLKYSSSSQKLTILIALCSRINDSEGISHYQKLLDDKSK